MAFSAVSGQAATTSYTNVNSVTLAFPGNVTAGNALVVGGGNWANPQDATIAVSDTRSTSYNTHNQTISGRGTTAFLAWGTAPTGGACTVTVNPAGTNGWGSFTINEYQAADTIGVDATFESTTGSSTSPSDSITNTVNDGLLLGVMAPDDTHFPNPSYTIGTPTDWTQVGEDESTANNAHHLAHRITTTSGTYTPTWSLSPSANWAVILVALKEVAAGGIAVPTATSTQVKEDYNASSGSSRQVTFDYPVKTGNGVLAFVFWKDDVTITSVQDSASNTYASGIARHARPTDGYLQCYGAKNVTGGQLSVTVNFSGTATSIYIALVEVIMAHGTTLFGATATGTATSGSVVTSGTFSPTFTRGCIFAFAVGDVSATAILGSIGGVTACRTSMPVSPNGGLLIEELPFTAQPSANITASADLNGTLSKAAIIVVEVQAASAVYATAPVVGTSGDGRFTLGGQPMFLIGPTYFDAIDWWYSDLRSMQTYQYNTCRILLDKQWDDGGTGTESVFNSNGTIRPSRMARIHALILTAAEFGMAVEVVIHVADGLPNTASFLTTEAAREAATTNAVAELKDHLNVYWDLCNEFNYDQNAAYDQWTATRLQGIVDAALAEDPDGVFCVSGAGGGTSDTTDWALEYPTDHIIAADITPYLASGLPVFGYHAGRETDWWKRVGFRANVLKAYLESQGRPAMPVYMNEEARVGSVNPPDPTAVQMIQAAINCARSRAAGYIFHSDASFTMLTATMVSQFTADELTAYQAAAMRVWALLRRIAQYQSFPRPVLRG